MSLEENTSSMVENDQQTNQSHAQKLEVTQITPEEERATRVMACDIQRFYNYVRQSKNPLRKSFTHYEIALARFIEPTCSITNDWCQWPDTWLDGQDDLERDLEAFCPKAKHLLQQLYCLSDTHLGWKHFGK
ncbi:hypothetical protein FBEOM_3298 [Fusarium beomiforme]|uniref:Uncharacterized protein n=1 Tax=Fusarium beomiforme TaxID=44412 RepID=A0A9P5DZC2_9HYPO|nr:hypothetical protein FBEOM_3298 [Fusarium beomiforme]